MKHKLSESDETIKSHNMYRTAHETRGGQHPSRLYAAARVCSTLSCSMRMARSSALPTEKLSSWHHGTGCCCATRSVMRARPPSAEGEIGSGTTSIIWLRRQTLVMRRVASGMRVSRPEGERRSRRS
eukprot:scaffold14894_cov74-Phaeocystis_antarctica.AAC.4